MDPPRSKSNRYRELVDEGGIDNLVEKSRHKANHKNRIDQTVEDAVNQVALEFLAFGQVRASNELRKRGIFISTAGVRCAWLRSDLETFKKRLKALDKKVQEEVIILTETQMVALEKKKDDDVAFGEIETAHPGYLGSQDTFYGAPRGAR